MSLFEDWNTLDDYVEDELENAFDFQGRDVLLFCIDASHSMTTSAKNVENHDQKESYLQSVLEIAVQLQKRKVITSPNDLVGIMFYNTGEETEGGRTGGAEIKKHCSVYQNIAQMNAENIQRLSALIYNFKNHPEKTERALPPNKGHTPIGDVFTSCNWLFRDGAPKSGLKRIFLVTDEDDPHPGSPQFLKTAQTTFDDLSASGIIITPFFIQRVGKTFDRSKFWDQVLPPEDPGEDDINGQRPDIITELESLIQEMKIRELPKRAVFSVPFHLANDLTIGVKGYGLVTQQSKPGYKYFTAGRTMEEVKSKVTYYDAVMRFPFSHPQGIRQIPLLSRFKVHQKEYANSHIVFGMTLGSTGEANNATPTGVKNRVNIVSALLFRSIEKDDGIGFLHFGRCQILSYAGPRAWCVCRFTVMNE